MNIVETYHKKILKYKNKHKNEVCYIFGSGPTLNKFKKQEDGIFIGCNHILKHNVIKQNLNYYFFGHGYKIYTTEDSICGNHKKEVDMLDNKIKKFCMVSRNNNYTIHNFTENSIKELENINAIPCDMNLTTLYKDLEEKPFLNHSIIFPCIQFALYAGFTKIYLVGCDCNLYGQNNTRKYFFDNNINNNNIDKNYIKLWKDIYEFKNKNYKNTKIININPVGLKSLMDIDINI